MNGGIDSKLMLIEAGPGGRTTKEMASIGRYTTPPYSSLEEELKTRLRTPSTGEQKDISIVAMAAYFSGSIVMLVAL
jgi:hypothetical protein